MLHSLRLALVALTFLVPTTVAQAQTAALGTWDVTTSSPQGDTESVVEIRDVDGKLVAIGNSARGERPYDSVSIDGTQITLMVTISFNGTPMVITYTGRVEGTTMSGAADFGGMASGTWSAVKKSRSEGWWSLGLLAPVFDSNSRYTGHVLDVRGHEGGAECQCMRGNRYVEILDARPTAFEYSFDAAIRVAHVVGPFEPLQLRTDEVEPCLQGLPAFGPRQSFDAYAISATTGCGTPTSPGSVAASRSTTAGAPFMSADTALVSST